MHGQRALGVGLVLLSGIAFASGSVFATLSYDQGIDWLTLSAWRFIIAASAAWIWVLASPKRRASVRRLPRRQVVLALGLGAMYTGNAGTYYASIEIIPAVLAGVIVYLYPIFVALLSLRFVTRLDGRRPWFALGLATLGVVLALGGLDMEAGVPWDGLALVFASAIIYAVWIVLSARLAGERRDRLAHDTPKGAGQTHDAAITTALMILGTATVFTILSTVAGQPPDPRTIPTGVWPHLLGLGLLASFLAIQTLYAGARRIGAAQAALVGTTEPVFIVLLTFLILDQRLGPIQLIGAACIVTGVLIAQTGQRGPDDPQPATPFESEGHRFGERSTD